MSAYSEAVLADSPRLYLRLGEAEGTTAADSSGKEHPGTYKNTPTLGIAGAIGGDSDTAVKFDGASKEFVEVADHADLDLGDIFTLEAQVKIEPGSAEMSIIAKGSGAYQMRLGEEGSRHVQLLRQNTKIMASSGIEVPEDGKWHHVLATKSGATRKVYIDGVDVTSLGTDSTCANTATALRVACKAENDEQFTGGLDEVAVYATALSAERAFVHYAAATVHSELPVLKRPYSGLVMR